ncbi:MAG: hypothetical protein U0167_09050 [bacterium]
MMSRLSGAWLAGALLLAAPGEPCQGAPAARVRAATEGGAFPTVRYDLAASYLPSLGQSVFFTTSPTFELPLVLSEPTGSYGQVSWMAYSMTTNMGSVGFEGSQTAASYPLTFASAPTFNLYSGWLLGKGLTYLVLPQSLEIGLPSAVTPVLLQEVGGRSTSADSCWATFLCVLEQYVTDGYPSLCLLGERGPGGGTTLARYRDEILSTTPEGQYYAHLYKQYSPDMVRATAADPSLFVRAVGARDAWVTAIQALVDGGGGGATVTTQMQDDLNAILDSFAAHGSPALASVVATERQRLQLDAIAGLDMTAFQHQIETLGGVSAVEPHSWGQIKALYR